MGVSSQAGSPRRSKSFTFLSFQTSFREVQYPFALLPSTSSPKTHGGRRRRRNPTSKNTFSSSSSSSSSILLDARQETFKPKDSSPQPYTSTIATIIIIVIVIVIIVVVVLVVLVVVVVVVVVAVSLSSFGHLIVTMVSYTKPSVVMVHFVLPAAIHQVLTMLPGLRLEGTSRVAHGGGNHPETTRFTRIAIQPR